MPEELPKSIDGYPIVKEIGVGASGVCVSGKATWKTTICRLKAI